MRALLKLFAIAFAFTALPASSHEVKHGQIKIVHPWTMETDGPGAKDAAVYMTIKNLSTKPDRLMAARCAAAQNVELVTSGPAVGPLEVMAGSDLMLNRDGPRIMLRGLTKSLSPYDMLPLTLVFEKAGEVKIEVMVEERS